MTTIEEAWAAIELAAEDELDDAVRAGFLTAHVDACRRFKAVMYGPNVKCSQDGWYCDTAKEIEELGK